MIYFKNFHVNFDFQRIYFLIAIYTGIVGLWANDRLLVSLGLFLILLNGFRIHRYRREIDEK